MADDKRYFKDLPRATEVPSDGLFPASFPDDTTFNGYSSFAVTVAIMAETILGRIDYDTDLETENKKVYGAINEVFRQLPKMTWTDEQRLSFLTMLGCSVDEDGVVHFEPTPEDTDND